MGLLRSVLRGAFYVGLLATSLGVVTVNPAVIAGGIVLIGAAHGLGKLLTAIGPKHERPRTGLAAVAEGGTAEEVKSALARGADPNLPSSDGSLPLTVAAMHGNSQVARLLLESGARDTNDALCWAANGGDKDLVTILVDAGADPNWRDPAIGSALIRAVRAGHTEIVELLLDAGAVIDDTAIEASVRHTSTLALLLKRGATITATMTRDAIASGNADSVLLLVNAGADRDRALGDAITMRGSRPDMIRLLVASGANPESATVQESVAAASQQASRAAEILENLTAARNSKG